jgi:hypothetical protein
MDRVALAVGACFRPARVSARTGDGIENSRPFVTPAY